MGRARLLPFCLLLLAAPALGAGVKIHVDYDGATVFGEYTTFQLLETRHDLRPVSPELHLAVARQLISDARLGGLALVPTDPDIYFAYYAASAGELRLAPEELGYAHGEAFTPGSYWQGAGGVRGDDGSFTFERGTLVLDVWDRQRRVLVWRGTAAGALKGDFVRNRTRLGRSLEKLMRRWEEMYGTRAQPIRELEPERQR